MRTARGGGQEERREAEEAAWTMEVEGGEGEEGEAEEGDGAEEGEEGMARGICTSLQ